MAHRWVIGAVAGFALVAAALGIALAVVVAGDDDSSPAIASGAYGPARGMAWGMVAGPGNWDPESMRSYMPQTLGAEGYEAMVAHMRVHPNGNAQDGAGFDQTWHAMMDGMMRGWSRDDRDRCWGWMTGG